MKFIPRGSEIRVFTCHVCSGGQQTTPTIDPYREMHHTSVFPRATAHGLSASALGALAREVFFADIFSASKEGFLQMGSPATKNVTLQAPYESCSSEPPIRTRIWTG
jgi:hypothetical protein